MTFNILLVKLPIWQLQNWRYKYESTLFSAY